MRPRSPRRSSSPAPPPSLHAPHRTRNHHHHAGSSAVHAPHWSSSPAPSLSPCRILRRPCDHAPGRVLHAGARRRRSCPPRRSSSSAPPELVVGIADVSSSTLAAPTVARALMSQGGGEGAIPLGHYPNGIPVYSSFPI
uniref:Uncharacterized protein n=1 Tax=Oryza barthii TaxID=65489 RepID=A0A0D3H1A2_9ORYZ